MKRRLAREIAVQSLYHMEMNATDARAAVRTVLADGREDDEPVPAYGETDVVFVVQLVEGTNDRLSAIDDTLKSYLKGWRPERLSRVDRQILRLAAFELFFVEETPPKVIINEAIELAKHFGTEESGKFVNGVLGQMLRDRDAIMERLNQGERNS